MNVLYISSFAVIAAEPAESRKLYLDALGLPLTRHRWWPDCRRPRA